MRRLALLRSVQDVAEKAALGVQRLKDIETGDVRPSAEELFALAEALHVKVATFFAGMDGGVGE